MRYVVEFFDDDERRRTSIVDVVIPPEFRSELERMKPFVAEHLKRPKKIVKITAEDQLK